MWNSKRKNKTNLRHGHPVSLVGNAESGDVAVHVHLLGTCIQAFCVKFDVDLAAGAVGRIEAVEVAGVLEDDELAVGAGELDVVLLEVGDFLGRAGLRVVDEDVHPVVAVGDEEDFFNYYDADHDGGIKF